MFNMKNKKIDKLKSNWAKPIDRFRNFDFIAFLHTSLSKDSKNENYVDKKTWSDLNFDDIFSIIDRNISPIGQQYLYHILHKYEYDQTVLSKRTELIELFKNNSELREKIQIELLRLDETNANFIAPLIFGDLPKRPKFYQLFFVLSYLALISFLLVFINGAFIFLAIALFLTNLTLNNIYSNRIHRYFAGFSSLNLLLITAQKISKLNIENISEINYINSKAHLIKRLNKKIGSLVFNKAAMNDMLSGIVDYLNIYFLYDLKKYSTSVGLIQQNQNEIRQIFLNIAELDSAISVASYLSMVPIYCNPIFEEFKTITFKKVYHPLLVNAISNDINSLNKSLLITGSNMAGKTTFIKTVGINIILSQTLNICLADKAIIPRLNVKSTIRREENLEDSKSYFFVEVEELLEFIKLSENHDNYIFLIDEIFRGTNTIERLSASTAVLEYLNRNNFVMVTTHDIELQEMLNLNFVMIHFSERVEKNKFFFDYKLQDGPTSSGNAIKLLEIKGYPKSIIEQSVKVSKTLLKK